MKRTLNFIGNVVGVTALLLFFAAAFYHLTNDYFFLWGKHRDFSLIGWGMMFLLWGTAFCRFRKKDTLLLETAGWATLLCIAFEAYRFLIYAGYESCRIYLTTIMGLEIVTFVLALIYHQKKIVFFGLSAFLITFLGIFFVLPGVVYNIYFDIVVFVCALLWLTLNYVKDEKIICVMKRCSLAIILCCMAVSGWKYYDLRAEGIRFYETGVKEAFKEPKVSIVVPVYNAEDTVERAIDSLRHQSLKEIEIIAVDDGSTDKTAEILDKYAAFDKRIKVIHQKNAYIGAARNRGMHEAKSKYIAFIDADDRVDFNFFEELYKEAEKSDADIVYTTQIWKVKNKFPEVKEKLQVATMNERQVCFESIGTGFVWNKLYKLDFLKKNNILFSTRRTIYEDSYFSLQLIMHVNKVSKVDNVAYYFSRYEESTCTVNVNKSSIGKVQLDVFLDLDELIQNSDFDEEKKEKYLKFSKDNRNYLFEESYVTLALDEDRVIFKKMIEEKFPDDEIDFDMLDERIMQKKGKIKVSVIMPVYNAERTVRRTLDSLLAQTLKEMEIIVVNDGSTDDTVEIVKEYGKKHPKIRLFKQENAYVGAARNRGQREAKGEYIAFIDADDTLSENFYERLYETAKKNNADVVAADHVVSVWEKENREELYVERQKFTDNEVIEDLADYRANVLGYVWDKIYRAEFLKEHDIWGTLRRTPAEDNYFTTQVLLYADKMYVAKDTTHYYWRGSASETGVKYTSAKDEIVEMFADLNKLIKKAKINKKKKESFFKAVETVRQKMLRNYFDCLRNEDNNLILNKIVKTFPNDETAVLKPANDNEGGHLLYQKVM